jgi:DNA-binding PadR family transcriptional regulator
MTNTSTDEYLPLTETILFILLSLAPGASHGYAIIKHVITLSKERVHLSTGTLYGALARLLKQGWIERVEGKVTDETGHPRKEYRLTNLGQRILRAEIERMRNLVGLASLQTAKNTR